ncbi:phosphonate C-P lyase system protein PhnH [Chelatococcus sp. SYSU_G07232]|uniref:Phosphonate C-P lyase system protein PhnH n=1 Tax=Chelatococcus albus TaxID=3047466 RepID=A0ABT7AI94_9HYPH|nr:phosphonate C-P lyase system protein PhnH [Chelatococcus sp. SYSU_G07232]MDJ1159105.1 phosphonate C-P lyase system protein PhnH [Chelatococcus sp. SYSU_G07232]
MAGNALARAPLAAGFADPVRDSQAVFRAVMTALARPALPQPLAVALGPPAPLTPELAAVALALADHEAPLWLDGPLASVSAVADFLRFHTGAPIVTDPAGAAFALVADAAALPPFDAFAQGTQDYPDRSTTVVAAVERLAQGRGLAFEGPGIRQRAALDAAPVPADLAQRLARNRALFPRGVDLVLVAPGRIAGLPRSLTPVGEP